MIREFIQKYYIDPIIYDTGYNPVNTLTWGIVLVLCLIGIFKLMRSMKVEIDRRFVFAVSPFILVGSTLRVLEDLDVFAPPLKYLFITPQIYFLTFGATLLCLLIGLLLERAELMTYESFTWLVALPWGIGNVIYILWGKEITIWVPFTIIGMGASITFVVWSLAMLFGSYRYTDDFNLVIIMAHMMDASSTYVGVDLLGYVEKHVIPSYLTELFGTASVLIPLKLIVILLVIKLIDSYLLQEGEDMAEAVSKSSERDMTEFANLLKFAILTLGAAPAIRNTLRMTIGV
ncbi:MAG: hypothetical protein PWR13_76 [Archaeoglobi archaeon]|nr:DUF63 family protein [Candidatus Mnemosynella bozhongmuii]MDI3501917.1 hypothetical protein [Archaeoglobi archaeon]MDK2781048.1 hypothetical protein [Archaeoglobi archaeon]